MHWFGCLPRPRTPMPHREEALRTRAPAGFGPLPAHPVPHASAPHPRAHLPVWPLACGAFSSELSLGGGGRNPNSVFWPGQTWDRCWTGRGHRATSRCPAVAIPSQVRGGGGGARRVSALPQSAPIAGGGILPRLSARQSKGLTKVSLRTMRLNSLFGPLPTTASFIEART